MVYTTNASTYMGPVEIGLFVAMVLFGCSIVQGYLYFSTFRKDPLVFKAMVAATLALESAYIISVASCVWTMTISSVNDPSLLLVYPIGAELGLVFTIFISGITETFFIYRLVKFSKTLAFPALCGTISFLTVISGMIVAGEAFRMTSVAEFQTTQFRLINLLLVSDSACALLITTGMVYHLRKSRSRGLPR
ncbi:hypothetical protein BJ138DRAFT_578752 [Hygrophoropsis aurantiaca]|uniref:Uncharacterized protein n=1 Tax=Hygrophoropsis aurantiaca TaxID=72124 RepID=A0ACB8A0I0_9AGAM|nr:hypothetical protein BJ138DRAFT_578752 [Hygrophoropsis aurantiaca]